MSYARKRIGMVVAVAMLAIVPAVPAEAADKRTQVFKPARTSTQAVTFKLRGVEAQRVLRAALVRRGKVRRRLSPAAARSAARRGVLRVRVRSTHRRRMGRILFGSVAIRRKRSGLWVRRAARTSVKLRVVSDTRAPQTSITSSPDETTESTSATFRFRADERDASFECQVDGGDWRSCSSPTDFTEVPEGDHSFSVRARDRSGNVDASPATREWTVVAPGALEEVADPTADEAVAEETAPAGEEAAATGDAVFEDSFSGANGVITNHYAFWSPDDRTAFRSPNWEMESGCALRQDNTLWSGVPTANEPNRDCSNGSGSEVFRFWTKRTDFGNVAVSMRLRNNGYAVGSQGERSWDGVKIWLRRQGASGSHGLYTVEVNRRQGNIMIQKKCANSDTYHILEQARPTGAAASIGSWEDVGGSVQNQPDGTVKLTMVRHGQTVLEAFDEGVGCAPITTAGRVGVRGDSTNFNVDDFRVVPAV